MGQIVNKKINLQLVGIDGNAFSIMGTFQKQAKREGWSNEEIDKVLNEATSGDYNHLLATIMDHCETDSIWGDDDEELDDDEYDDDEYDFDIETDKRY